MDRKVTLGEFFVIILIMVVLGGILYPVFAKGREKARQSSCLSNEKRIVLAVLQYVQDYDERLPIRYGDKAPWRAVGEYSRTPELFLCLGDPRYKGKAGKALKVTGEYHDCLSYAYRGTASGVAAISVAEPGCFPLLLDWSGEKQIWGLKVARTDNNALASRHDEGLNVAFLDGHTRYYYTDKFRKELETNFNEEPAPELRTPVDPVLQVEASVGYRHPALPPDKYDIYKSGRKVGELTIK